MSISSNLTLAQAIVGFEINCKSRRLSPCTISDYFTTLRYFIDYYSPELPVNTITREHIIEFLASFPDAISKKTILNYHTGLSAFWTFLLENNFVEHHILRDIQRPRPEQHDIVPFTETEVRTLFSALRVSKLYTFKNNRAARNTIPENIVLRNRVILMIFLDTGIRVSELCKIKIQDFNHQAMTIHIVHGKGAKDRIVYLSHRTNLDIWKYQNTREMKLRHHPLVATKRETVLDRSNIYKILNRLGERAGVYDVHPHRFRHTFAITYLRNGGDVYTLQKILGHSTLEMVKRYLSIAQTDIKTAHRMASPVDRWAL